MTAILAYFALLIMPWWIPMPIAFLLILWLPMNKWNSFLATAFGGVLCFIFISMVKDFGNNHILSSKIAVIFHLPSSVFLILITGLIGFITTGLGGWTASILVSLIKPSGTLENEESIADDLAASE